MWLIWFPIVFPWNWGPPFPIVIAYMTTDPLLASFPSLSPYPSLQWSFLGSPLIYNPIHVSGSASGYTQLKPIGVVILTVKRCDSWDSVRLNNCSRVTDLVGAEEGFKNNLPVPVSASQVWGRFTVCIIILQHSVNTQQKLCQVTIKSWQNISIQFSLFFLNIISVLNPAFIYVASWLNVFLTLKCMLHKSKTKTMHIWLTIVSLALKHL